MERVRGRVLKQKEEQVKNISKNVPYMFAKEQKGGRGADKSLIL